MQKRPPWAESKVTSKVEVIQRTKLEGKKVHVATLMDVCHLKNSEMEKKFQQCNGRVVSRGDSVVDNTDGGNSLNVISRLLGCSGQASDAVSAGSVGILISIMNSVFRCKCRTSDFNLAIPLSKLCRSLLHSVSQY